MAHIAEPHQGLEYVGVATTRRAVLWVPDWPVVAAMAETGITADLPAAVVHGRGVTAVSAAARTAGVTRGMRKRLAQSRCPNLLLLAHDPMRDARLFESVAVAAERVVPGMEIARPGMLLIPSEGAARFHGGEEVLAEALVTAVAEYAGYECSVGMADGLLAAIVAARASLMVPPGRLALVPPGASAEYLAPLPVETLSLAAMEQSQRVAVEDLVHVLMRLGLVTLGDFTALPSADVLARFGAQGMWARRMALGEDVTPPVLRRQESDIVAEYVFDEPAQRIEQLTWVAESVARDLDSALLAAGVRCGKVCIAARTESGQTLERVWHTDVGSRSGHFARHMADRVRWQLEGWLSGTAVGGPEAAPVTALSITAHDVVALGSEQAYLWGGFSGADARAHRTIEQMQSLLGVDGVLAVQEQGGRSPRDRVLTYAWGQDRTSRPLAAPWPGHLPDPAPATVLTVATDIQVLDAGGRVVHIDRRLGMSAPPTWVLFPADPGDHRMQAMSRHPASGLAGRDKGTSWRRPQPIEAWAGPWAVAQRWWSEDSSRKAYLQVSLRGIDGSEGEALLVSFEAGAWMLEAIYD